MLARIFLVYEENLAARVMVFLRVIFFVVAFQAPWQASNGMK
jgi:hypothetical protein